MHSWWSALSVLGSLAVTGPLGVAIALWLLAGRSWRLTLSWLLLFGAGMAMVVATKVAFIGWGVGIPEVKFAGLSGHAMRACAVFPVAFYLAFRRAQPAWRRGAFAVGVLLAVLISFSRLPVLAHSASEVVLGGAVGFAVAAAFIALSRADHPALFGRVLAALCVPVLLLAPRAEPVPTEQWMRELALYLSGKDKPHERNWTLRSPRI
ncbi:phosphatase PAP2 family protein [Massilia endophytica]|uniref:phosphatase PAP2 family protein n=1 Tax=Massilia endophytica TaxID=2899220 RepID=UPI001E555C5A|nr:phosphatase PAP2 family protein [Massilia endophytica]UGQ48891.1 phosphatase PAP2 family protein [Massilia endophytica]